MAGSKKNNGANRLEEAMALLIQNQVQFLTRISDIDRINTDRFSRIEDELAGIRGLLLDHEQILRSLPEAIRDKIGFTSAKQKGSRS
jgi:hypothetical protein